ncbi:MAG: hypothetical protein DRQ14_03605 [Candidatus Latescibacterota bacterium]|nr:MAG: hypothetical protein DRQ14_03605 [Candidatus Latescibacterota bacterium]
MAQVDYNRININIGALNALNALNDINRRLAVHQTRLATGKRINSAADDAAGYTIANKLLVKAEGIGVALDNIASAKNLMTVAEGHLNNINDILHRMKALAEQAANDTLGTEERQAILEELQALNDQIDAEVGQAKWSDKYLLGNPNTSKSEDLNFQISFGTTSGANELVFNIAKNVWSSGGTVFNAAGLDVVASSTTIRSVSNFATLSTDYTYEGLHTAAVGNNTVGEFKGGHYTLEISSSGDGSNATVTIRLRDQNGDLVTIDADGVANGDVSTVLTTTVNSSNALINLGGGLVVSLSGISTANGDSQSALWSFDFTEAGNSVSSQGNAQLFMEKIDAAITKVSKALSYIGAMQNRLSFQEASLSVAKTNTLASYNQIMNADMAYEQLEATKLQILQQTATAMLATANMMPQNVLALFR